MTDIDTETKLRRGLEGYAASITVTPPPLDELFDRAAPRRAPLVVAGAGVAAVATAVVIGAVLTRNDDRQNTAVRSSGACGTGQAEERTSEDRTVAEGTLPDGRAWDVQVRGTPPRLGAWGTVAGEDVGGYEHNVWSWSGMVNEGALSWSLDVFDGGRLLFGDVPPSATTVEVHLDGGRKVSLCSIAVPGLDAVRFAATALPAGPDIREIVARDAAGQVVAQGAVAAVLPPSPTEGGYGFGIQVDPELVELPLGGVAADSPPSVPTEPVVSGALPSGPWSLGTGMVGDPRDPDYVVRMVLPEPHAAVTRAGIVGQQLQRSEWHVSSVDERLLVWGWSSTDVAEVVVVLDGGATVSLPVHSSGVDQFDVVVFADALPDGTRPQAIEGRASDGSVLYRAAGMTTSSPPLAALPTGETVSLTVDQPG